MDYTPFRVKIKHILPAKKKPGLTPLRGAGQENYSAALALAAASMAASRDFHPDRNLPMWQKIPPGIPETADNSASLFPAQAAGCGTR